MEQPPPKQNDISFLQKLENLQWLGRYPALTLMTFTRQDLGYRMVNPLWLIGVTLALLALTSFTDQEHRPDDLLVFALLFLTFGIRQRYLRWREFRQGVRQHSYYLGTSIFHSLPMPRMFRAERRIERTLEPALCFLAGLLLLPYSPALGLWLMFAATCVRGFEDVVYRRELHRRLDTVDGMVNSEIQAETVEQFSPPPDQALHREPAPGIPTGLGGDIGERIKRRKPH